MVDVIKAAVDCLDELYSILSPSFGPYGKEVLIQNNVGSIFITKKGISILRNLEMANPIGRLIKQSIEEFTNKQGDGCKVYVIVLRNIIKTFYHILLTKHHSQLVITSEVSRTLLLLSEHFESNKGFNEFALSDTVIAKQNVFHCKYLSNFVDTFLCGQYSIKIKEVFIKLINDLFSLITFDSNNIEYLLKYFSSFYIEAESLSFQHSKVVEGIIITRASVPRIINQTNSRFLVITGSFSRIEENMTELSLNDDKAFTSHLSSNQKILNKFIDVILLHKITLIITEESLPNVLQNLLISNNIAFISFVLEEEIEYICVTYDISPLSCLYDIFNIHSMNAVLGKATFFNSCIIGTKYYSHIGPPMNSRDTQKPCISLIIASPHAGMGNEYNKTTLQLFKHLANVVNSSECHLVPVGGVFESMLAKYLTLQHLNLTHDCCYIKNVVTNSLLEVMVVLSSNCCRNDQQKKDVKIALLKIKEDVSDNGNFYGINGKLGTLIQSSEIIQYESFNAKIKMITNLLHLSAQIFRITDVVPVKNRIKENEEELGISEGLEE